MRAAERTWYAMAAVVLGLSTACSSLPAPREWVPDPDEAPTDVRGAWANVRHYQGDKRVTTSGELVAVGQDSLFLISPSSKLIAFPWNHINRVQVAFFDPREGLCYAMGAGGAAASLSHGYIFVLSMPAWLIIGAATGAGRVGEATITYPSETEDWRDLRPYARFPQGLSRHKLRAVVDSTAVAAGPPPARAGQIPAEPVAPVPKYKPAQHMGNGIVFGGGFFEEGKGAWSLSYHGSVYKELFAMAGYTEFDDDAIDMSQWWAGVRLGDPIYFGVKYIYTEQELPTNELFYNQKEESSGVSFFGGFLVPTSEHVGIGAMAGMDLSGLSFPEGRDDLWWAQLLLQLTLFPADN